MTWRTLTFVLTGLVGAVLFVGSLSGSGGVDDHHAAPADRPAAAQSAPRAGRTGHGGSALGALARPAGVAAAFAGATAMFWLVSRRRRTAG